MGLYIDMEMPKDDMKNIMIIADGLVFQFSGYGNPKPLGIAVPVPEPHGRLIDEREINSRFDNGIKTISELPFPNDFVELYKQLATEVKEEIGKCHTIIPASKEE